MCLSHAALQVDKDDLPLGAPQLMMSFIANGQLRPDLQHQFEQRFNFTFQQAAAQRASITPNPATPLPNADFPWHSGEAWQTNLKLVPFVGLNSTTGAANNTAAGGAATTTGAANNATVGGTTATSNNISTSG